MLKEKLVKSLRSGEYKQYSPAISMKNGNLLDVSGVICDLHSKETNTPWSGDYYQHRKYVEPWSVRKWQHENGLPHVNWVALNNNYSFSEIADFIENDSIPEEFYI